jgi:AcrR family transcriptional regulator
MSKSGLFAHFGSKEELQLATVDMAAEIFRREVVRPALEAERGLPRLNAMLDGWLSYIERSVFSGGCFFSAASAEFDDRPGPVRDMIAGLMNAWLDAIAAEVAKAESLGQLDAGGDPAQIAFEVHAFVQGANWASRLLGDEKALDRARAAIRRRLEGAAT